MSKGITSNRGGVQIKTGSATVFDDEKTAVTGVTVTFTQTYTFGATGVRLFRNGLLMDKVGSFTIGGTTNAEEYQEVNNGENSTQFTLNTTNPATTDELFQLLTIKGERVRDGEGLDVYYTENFKDTTASNFAQGNDSTFLGGGALDGALSEETVSPLSETASLKYTMGASSTDDYFASNLIDIDLKQAGNYTGSTLYYTYNGDNGDVKFVFYDEDNTEILSSSLATFDAKTNATRYAISLFIPIGVTQVRWGAHVLVGNSGKILLIDDVQFSTDPYVYKDLMNPMPSAARGDGGSTTAIPSLNVYYMSFTSNFDLDGLFTNLGSSNSGTYTSATYYTAPSDGDYRVSASLFTSDADIDANDTIIMGIYINGSLTRQHFYKETTTITTPGISLAMNDLVRLSAGDNISIGVENQTGGSLSFSSSVESRWFSVTKEDITTTEHVVTPLENVKPALYHTASAQSIDNSSAEILNFDTVQSDPDSLVSVGASWKYTAKTDGVYTINTKITYVASTADFSPDLRLYINGSANKYLTIKTFKEMDTASAAVGNEGTVTVALSKDDYFDIRATQDSGGGLALVASTDYNYISVIKIDQNATLAAIPLERIAYIKDVKSSGTAGGDFNSGAWRTRDLNTLEGDTSFINLASDQFILQPGKYSIRAFTPGFYCDVHKAKLYNITDAADEITGSSEVTAPTTSESTTKSMINGSVTITVGTIFEIQHRCSTTKSGDGFGQACSFGDDEVYTQVEIRKLE